VVPCFGLAPYAGALRALEGLREGGTAVMVVSCAQQPVIERDVQRLGLATDGVFGCADKEPVLLELSRSLGRGLMLGDHPADQRAARSAGMRFLQARLDGQPSFAGSDGWFRSWREAALLMRYA